MKKYKILSIMASLVIVVFLLFIIISSCQYEPRYRYETTDDFITLFEENIDDFDDYVNRFDDHDMWVKYYEDTLDADFVNFKRFEKYTTEEEFEFLESFRNKYHPIFWGSRELEFYVEHADNVIVIKDPELTEYTRFKIERLEGDGATIKYCKNGWIIIY